MGQGPSSSLPTMGMQNVTGSEDQALLVWRGHAVRSERSSVPHSGASIQPEGGGQQWVQWQG